VLSRLDALGASLRTIKMVYSYLCDRTATLTLEHNDYTKTIERGCPQGSQLGPTLWKVVMTGIGKIPLEETSTAVLYADDIALLVGAARPQTALGKIESHLDKLID